MPPRPREFVRRNPFRVEKLANKNNNTQSGDKSEENNSSGTTAAGAADALPV